MEKNRKTTHTLIIEQVNGRIVKIAASGETQIVLIEKSLRQELRSILEPDLEFEKGKAHKLFDGDTKNFLQQHEI